MFGKAHILPPGLLLAGQFPGVGAAQDQDIFAPRLGRPVVFHRFAQRHSEQFFMHLGEFPGQCRRTVAKCLQQLFERLAEAVRGFVEDHRPLLCP